jgi:DNA-binding XRE family transcriptional regulator
MARKFKELYDKLPAASRARVEDRVKEYKAEMALEELRRVRKLTQVDLARNLGIAQGAVSKIEKRQDMHVGTLRKHIEAMGGFLQLRAVFPDGEVPVRLRGESVVMPPKRASRASAASGKKRRA